MTRLLFSRWMQTLLGTAVLAAVVWFYGPLWPPLEPVLPRIMVIQGMLVVWAVANAALDARRRRREAALAAGLLDGGKAAGDEAEAVGATLSKALALLKKSGRRGSLADLPWYVIIGPPGAGKTTALLNAGLTFTLAEQMGQAAVSGVGGTRLCEWWFTDRAVLIDTAGRYTTQDSDATVDRAGWDAFLGLLRRTRPRMPLNGVLVAIALPDVAQASAAERDAHATAIRTRVEELQARFGMRIPVYALFTKADLISGFSEFFDNLDQVGRDQVWGETFPLKPGDAPGERFAEGFRGLVQRLNERLLPRLEAEHRADRRGAIIGFPTQVASLERALAGFVAAAFPPVGIQLRGVYFASGTQEGTPIDRLTGAMARAFGIDQSRASPLRPEAGRSYFLGRLLRDVVFNEAMLVQEPPGARRRRTWLRAAAMAAVVFVAAGLVGSFVVGSLAASRDVLAVATALATYERSAGGVALDPVSDGDLRPVAALLDRASALTQGVASGPPGWTAFGFDQRGKLRAGALQVYRDGLTYALLPRLVWRLETEMRGNLARPDVLYDQTRVYLMLGGLGPLDPTQVRSFMEQDWAESYPGLEDAPLREDLMLHLGRLLAEPMPPITLDAALVATARSSISRVPLADRVYAHIRASAAATRLEPWRPLAVLGLAGVQVFTRASGKSMTVGVPGFFTATGFRTVLRQSLDAATRQVAGEAWVAGRQTAFAPQELAALEASVGALYAADFTAQWDAMLSDLDVALATSIPQAAQALYILTSPESPLRDLLHAVAAQLQVAAPGTTPNPAAAAIMAHFQPVIALGSGDGATLEHALRLIADIQQQFAKIAALPVGTARPAGGDDISNAVLAGSPQVPPPLSRWLLSIGQSALALRTGNVRRQIELSWSAPGGPAQACQAAVTHDPFTAGGPLLPLDTFTRVFGPGGLLDGFFNAQLKPFVDIAAKPWKPQAGAPVSAADVVQFQRAAAIRDAFFAPGQLGPQVRVEVAPAGRPPAAPYVVTLDLAGTPVVTGQGPPHPVQVTWPAPDPVPNAASDLTPGASLTSMPPLPSLPLSDTGPWAMFRLFARGRITTPRAGRELLTFPDGIAYDLHVAGATSPFTPGLLAGFHCPSVK